jgi:hypothetical protein
LLKSLEVLQPYASDVVWVILALTLVVVRITMEGIDASLGARLLKLVAQRGGEDRFSEDTTDIISDQKTRAEGVE